MQLEMTMLRMLADRESWSKLRGAIPRGGLQEATKLVAGRIGEYYKAFPDVQKIEKDPFLSWYFGTVKTNADAEKKNEWAQMVEQMTEPVPPELANGMFDKLLTLGSAHKVSDALLRYNDGEDVDIIAELSAVLDTYKANRRAKQADVIVNSNVLDLMDAAENSKGLKWPIPVFNDHMRPMAGGDFIGVCARPDNGKTSFVTHSLSHFAPQLEQVFGPNRPAMWFCNEGAARKIWLRMYQSIMGMSMTELGAFRRDVCKSNDTKFLDAIFEKLGGTDAVHIVDANKMTNLDIEDYVAKFNPSIVVYDMIDNVQFNGLTMHGGTRTDQVLESMYQWARNLCVETDHVGIATSQISGEGEGLAFPAKSMLKDSKTGKQGTFDVQLMIGATASAGMQDMRYFSTPKNKLRVDGSPSNMQVETFFDGSRGRFTVGKLSKYVQEDYEEPENVKQAEPTARYAPKAAKHDPLEGGEYV